MTTEVDANRFEKVLAKGLAVSIGAAGKTQRTSKPKDAHQLLHEAYGRLKDHPELRRVAPDGAVTYSDPILAVAASWGAIAEDIATASVEGDDLTESSIWRWAVTGVQAWINRGDKGMSELAARVPTRTLNINKDVARIAVVGDAGYRGVPQQRVILMIREIHERSPFDLIVHLGDTYFSAGEQEVLRHLLVPFSAISAPLVTLCGNHDLYHGPDGYLAALKVLKQPGRFFLIKTPHWRIAALDTSFGSARALRNDGKLDAVQLEWLNDLLVAKTKGDLILMSHHFIISGWDEPAKSLRLQLERLVRGRVFAWYWGHEHRCAYYDKGKWGFYGASIGNGAFLEKWSDAARTDTPATWHGGETRCSCSGIQENVYWPHGFVEIELRENRVTETYHLEGCETHVRELVR
jgi:predicted phosphodiesterase